jgi:hypothetical protein
MCKSRDGLDKPDGKRMYCWNVDVVGKANTYYSVCGSTNAVLYVETIIGWFFHTCGEAKLAI